MLNKIWVIDDFEDFRFGSKVLCTNYSIEFFYIGSNLLKFITFKA